MQAIENIATTFQFHGSNHWAARIDVMPRGTMYVTVSHTGYGPAGSQTGAVGVLRIEQDGTVLPASRDGMIANLANKMLMHAQAARLVEYVAEIALAEVGELLAGVGPYARNWLEQPD